MRFGSHGQEWQHPSNDRPRLGTTGGILASNKDVEMNRIAPNIVRARLLWSGGFHKGTYASAGAFANGFRKK
jgi:hypothetical protein